MTFACRSTSQIKSRTRFADASLSTPGSGLEFRIIWTTGANRRRNRNTETAMRVNKSATSRHVGSSIKFQTECTMENGGHLLRYVISGGAGFIGSHLCEYLLNR